MAEIKASVGKAAPAPTQPAASHSDSQVNLLQQQLTALTAMMATSLQHPALHPATASLSGYGTPPINQQRATPPVYQPQLADVMQLGEYSLRKRLVVPLGEVLYE